MDLVKPQVVVLYNVPSAEGEASDAGVLREVDDVAAALGAGGFGVERLGVTRETLLAALSGLAARRDRAVVFNLCEGLDGDARHEPTVAGLLELYGLRYTGNTPTTLACALDKRLTKAVLFAAGIPTPAAQVFRAVPQPEAVKDRSFPLVVKPLREDASLGVTADSFVRTAEELVARVAHVLETFRQPALAEVYLEGREFNVAVVGDPRRARVLPVAEIAFEGYAEGEPRLVTHDAKWREGSADDRRTVPRCPAEIGENLRARLETAAVASYRALECRDYARLDLRLDGRGNPQVLEVNPNPDISRGAGLARAVEAGGEGYPSFLAQVVGWAWDRS
ncbi:MAG: D-alanine--D-alanine ligase family protein [Deferrisomatales bacterium]